MAHDSNYATYDDPANYDLESGRVDLDGSILLELATQAAGPVLELGCGTGRVTIPLASHGIDITGLDLLPHMLDHARSKAPDLPIRWECADVRYFQLNSQFELIFTRGAVFQHLLTRPDQEAMLQRVRRHLAPGGRFLIDAGFKSPPAMVDVPEEQEWFTYTDDRGREIQLTGTDHYDHINQIWTQTSYQNWQEAGEAQRAGPIKLDLRYFMPQELETLLHYNGFAVLSRYGDWPGNSLTEHSFAQLYLCALHG